MEASRRFVVIWFSDWLANISCPSEMRPACVIEERSMGAYLVAANATAQKLNIHAGQRLSEARVLAPELVTYPVDWAKSTRHLQRVARWANRFTPWVGYDPVADGLILDITGCAHLFGGERALLDHIVTQLARHAISARAACAGTIGAAWALAHHAPTTPVILPQGQEAEALMPLSVKALRLSDEQYRLCRQFGLDRISHIMRQPRASLVQRLGAGVIERLDQAFGQVAETVDPLRPPTRFHVTHVPLMPIQSREEVMFVLSNLVDDLVAELHRAGRGARRIDVRLIRTDRAVLSVSLALSHPIQLATHIVRLLTERLEHVQIRLDQDLAIEQLEMLASQTDIMSAHQDALFASLRQGQKQALAHLCDRILARLGQAPTRPLLRGRYMPEKVVRFIPITEPLLEPPLKTPLEPWSSPQKSEGALTPEAHIRKGWLAARPIILLPHAEQIDVIAEIPEGAPRRFRWRRRLYEVVMAAGPERISPEWWCEELPHSPDAIGQTKASLTRDYFRLEDSNGYRFWLYRDGLFTRETVLPRWYMHGFFA